MLNYVIMFWEGVFDLFALNRYNVVTAPIYDANWVVTGYQNVYYSNIERGLFLGVLITFTYLGILYATYRISRFFILKIWNWRKK